MVTYPIQNLSGDVIGSITLDNDDIPQGIMKDNFKFFVGGSWTEPGKKFLSFFLIPEGTVAMGVNFAKEEKGR